MPAKRLEVTELDIDAGEADVLQETVVKLHQLTPGAPYLGGLPPGMQNSPDDTGRRNTDGYRMSAVLGAASRDHATLTA